MQKILSEIAKGYLDELKLQGKSPRTLYTYGKDIEQILAFFGKDKDCAKITLPLVGKFYRSDELLKLPSGENRAPQTVRKTIRVFRMLLTWAQTQGYIDGLPLPKMVPFAVSKGSESATDLLQKYQLQSSSC